MASWFMRKKRGGENLKEKEEGTSSSVVDEKKEEEYFGDVPDDAGASSERKLGVDVESGLTLRRALGRIDGMALIISSIIGSGIFASPGVLLNNVGGDAMLAMIIWVFGALLATCQGFIFAELGTLMPSAGGEYTYMRAAFSDNVAFTWSFSRFWVILAGSRGILAFTFARYLYGAIYPDDTTSSDAVWLKKFIAIGAIMITTIMNCFKINFAAHVMKTFVSLKLVLVALLSIFMIIQLSRSTAVIAENFGSPFASAKFANMGSALIAAMWAYAGAGNIIYIGEEMNDPVKDTAPAIMYSLLVVLVAYVSCNLAYFSALTSAEIMDTSVVATDTARVIVGVAGSIVVSLFISISVLGTLFNGILAAGRFAYATARDGQFPAVMARLSKTQHTPYVALLIHGTMSSLFLLIPGSSISTLLSFTSPVGQAFDLLLVVALIKLRWQKNKFDDVKAFKMVRYCMPHYLPLSIREHKLPNPRAQCITLLHDRALSRKYVLTYHSTPVHIVHAHTHFSRTPAAVSSAARCRYRGGTLHGTNEWC